MEKTGTLADLVATDSSSAFLGNGIFGMSDDEMNELLLEAYDRGIARQMAIKEGLIQESIDYGNGK